MVLIIGAPLFRGFIFNTQYESIMFPVMSVFTCFRNTLRIIDVLISEWNIS